ncbi:unnamed protein product, partial [Iphiclides podalirius]
MAKDRLKYRETLVRVIRYNYGTQIDDRHRDASVNGGVSDAAWRRDERATIPSDALCDTSPLRPRALHLIADKTPNSSLISSVRESITDFTSGAVARYGIGLVSVPTAFRRLPASPAASWPVARRAHQTKNHRADSCRCHGPVQTMQLQTHRRTRKSMSVAISRLRGRNRNSRKPRTVVDPGVRGVKLQLPITVSHCELIIVSIANDSL